MFKPAVRYYVVNCKQKVYLNSVTVNLCTKYKVYIHNSVCIVALQSLQYLEKYIYNYGTQYIHYH